LVNGYISHQQTVQQFNEEQQAAPRKPEKPLEEQKQGAQ